MSDGGKTELQITYENNRTLQYSERTSEIEYQKLFVSTNWVAEETFEVQEIEEIILILVAV
jgi:hypothetical protein